MNVNRTEEMIDFLKGQGYFTLFVEELKTADPSAYRGLKEEFDEVLNSDIFGINFLPDGTVEYYYNEDQFGHNYLEMWTEEWLENWYEYISDMETNTVDSEKSIAEIVEEIFGDYDETLERLADEAEPISEEEFYGQVFDEPETDEKEEAVRKMEFMSDVIDSANNSLNWLQDYIEELEERIEAAGYSVSYTIMEEYNEVYASIEIKGESQFLGKVIGKAVCTEEDTFSKTIGKSIALVRAHNLLYFNQLEEE